MKKLSLMILCSSLLLSKELPLDSLLTQYSQASSLSKQTKQDTAGYLTLYTRDDLDKMQANTLYDVLNTIQFFSLQMTRLGQPQLIKAGAKSSATPPVKIFINSHELSNTTFGNAVLQYGDMNLYFIDHIEVYQAGNSVSFGSESGSMIIVLYTKKPSRENGTYGQFMLDSQKSSRVNLLSGDMLSDQYSYLLNVDLNKNNAKTYHMNGYDLKKEYKNGHFFFQFNKKEEYTLEVGATKGNRDAFTLLSTSPLKSELYGDNLYLHAVRKFDGNLKIKFSTSQEDVELQHRDAVGVKLSNQQEAKNLNIKIVSRETMLTTQKRFFYDNDKAFIALQLKRASFKLKNFQMDGMQANLQTGFDHRDLITTYGENIYNFNENNLLITGFKFNAYSYDSFKHKETSFLYRFGYVANLGSFKNKFFVLNRVIQPTVAQATFSPLKIKANSLLKSSNKTMITGASDYSFDKDTTLEVSFGITHTRDAIVVDKTSQQYINSNEEISKIRINSKLTHTFNINNKFILEAYKFYRKKSFTPDSGITLMVYDTIGKVDIYNELIYKSKYTNEVHQDMPAGYDYSLAVAYPVTKRLNFKLKGENLLDKASETSIYELNKDKSVASSLFVPSRERRVLLSMEYSF